MTQFYNGRRLTSMQSRILEHTNKTPSSIKEMHESFKVSMVYVRQQVALLVEMGALEKVDNRQPYIYRPKPINLEELASVEKYTKALRLKYPDDIDYEDVKLKPILKNIVSMDKTKWSKAIIELELIVRAMREMEGRGEFLETPVLDPNKLLK